MGSLASKPEDDPQTPPTPQAVVALPESLPPPPPTPTNERQTQPGRVGTAAQPMAAESRYRCVATLRGHTNYARRRRPVEPRG